MRSYHVYILSNRSRTLYIGVTGDLARRIHQHRMKAVRAFTRDYNVTMVVHVEEYTQIGDAIEREKQLKRWSRTKKIALIERENPDWLDLSTTW